MRPFFRKMECALLIARSGRGGVMQSLTENREIDAVSGDGRFLHVAEPILDVAKTMFLRQLRRELDHLRRIIDRDDFARVFREQLRQGSFACAQIRHG